MAAAWVARAPAVIGRASPALSRLQSQLQRLRGPVSTLGWLVVGLAAAAGLIGSRLGWQELTLLATTCAVTLAFAAAFTIGRSTYHVTLTVQLDRVVVGERAAGRLAVSNASARRLLPVVMELPIGQGRASFGVPSLTGRASHDELFVVPTTRRGVIVLGPVRSVRGDPLGLLRRELSWTEPTMIFVHPRTVMIDEPAAGLLRDLEGQPTSDVSSSDLSFHTLREYAPGDDRRHVHWRSTARTGTIMIRQFEDTRRAHLALALDDLLTDYVDDDEFELAVSICGSLGLRALRQEQDLSAIGTTRPISCATPRRLLDGLSGITHRGAGRSFAHITQEAASSVTSASIVALITGSAASITELRQAALRFSPDVRVVVFRAVTGSEPRLQVLGQISILTIGALEDLPRVLRRTVA